MHKTDKNQPSQHLIRVVSPTNHEPLPKGKTVCQVGRGGNSFTYRRSVVRDFQFDSNAEFSTLDWTGKVDVPQQITQAKVLLVGNGPQQHYRTHLAACHLLIYTLYGFVCVWGCACRHIMLESFCSIIIL